MTFREAILRVMFNANFNNQNFQLRIQNHFNLKVPCRLKTQIKWGFNRKLKQRLILLNETLRAFSKRTLLMSKWVFRKKLRLIHLKLSILIKNLHLKSQQLEAMFWAKNKMKLLKNNNLRRTSAIILMKKRIVSLLLTLH